MSIYEYLEDVYAAGGIDAWEDVNAMMWDLFNDDDESLFDTYVAEHGIDLSARTTDHPEDDFTLWCWDQD